MKIRVAVVFGGRSGEHEVSLASARSIMDNMDRSKYEVIPVGITREGRWLLEGEPMRQLEAGARGRERGTRDHNHGGTERDRGREQDRQDETDGQDARDVGKDRGTGSGNHGGTAGTERGAGTESAEKDNGEGAAGVEPTVVSTTARADLAVTPSPTRAVSPSGSPLAVDVVFPVLHGPYGEDGTIQGLLEMAGVPYVGGGVLASAAGMDKAAMKALFRQHGLPVVKDMVVRRREWESEPERIMDRIEESIGYPCFVKPANLGSSVGISKATSREGLKAAMETAARFDRKLIVEEGLDAREIECSVLGNDEPEASVPGEVVPCNEFYDYRAKYVDEGSQLLIPAPLPQEVADEVRRLAVETFQAVDCSGMARVDFFVEKGTGRVLVNEINTIPGFTKISMYPKLWEASGLPYSKLIDRLIELALERQADKLRNQTAYE